MIVQYRVSVAYLQFVHVLSWGLQLCTRHSLFFQFESTCLHVTQNIPYVFQYTNHLFWLFIGVLVAATTTVHTSDFTTDVTIIPKACFDIPVYRLTQSDFLLHQGKPIIHTTYSVSCPKVEVWNRIVNTASFTSEIRHPHAPCLISKGTHSSKSFLLSYCTSSRDNKRCLSGILDHNRSQWLSNVSYCPSCISKFSWC